MKIARMLPWILLALAFYTISLYIDPVTHPQIQTAFLKAGHITAGAYIGFWLDRHLFGTLTAEATPLRLVSRAIVVAASIIGMAAGL